MLGDGYRGKELAPGLLAGLFVIVCAACVSTFEHEITSISRGSSSSSSSNVQVLDDGDAQRLRARRSRLFRLRNRIQRSELFQTIHAISVTISMTCASKLERFEPDPAAPLHGYSEQDRMDFRRTVDELPRMIFFTQDEAPTSLSDSSD
ncbi:hypothetical protein CPC08DRAFT_243243 [Agrocybe pediades]|nr:hypothetical protein CPC08DRAFT_243243 [Agrocybe pediades]